MADWEDAPGRQSFSDPDKQRRFEEWRASEKQKYREKRIASGDPTVDMSGWETVKAGVGSTLAKMGRGAGQRLGIVSQQEVAEARERDAPLMATPGGKFGAFIGEVAPMAAASAIAPGANTILGSGVMGGARGFIEPTTEGESVARNTAMGGAVGSGAAAALKGVGRGASALLGASERKLGERAAENALRDEGIREAKALGYKLTPNQSGAGRVGSIAEGLSGSAKLEKLASVKNQEVTNRLVREDLEEALQGIGIKHKVGKLTDEALAEVRNKAGKAYQELDRLRHVNYDPKFDKALSELSLKAPSGAVKHPAQEAVEELVTALKAHPEWTGKSLRADITRLREMARSNLNAAKRAGGDIEKNALGLAQSKAAGLLEELAERNLMYNGAPSTVVRDYRSARQLMAKTYDVANALDDVGNVSARTLAKGMDKGKPVSGKMEKAAKFGSQFEGSARDVGKMRDVAESSFGDLLLGGMSAVATGNPLALAAAGARPAARSVMLSDVGQKMLGAPTYTPSASLRLSDLVANNARVKQGVPLSALAVMNTQQQ